MYRHAARPEGLSARRSPTPADFSHSAGPVFSLPRQAAELSMNYFPIDCWGGNFGECARVDAVAGQRKTCGEARELDRRRRCDHSRTSVSDGMRPRNRRVYNALPVFCGPPNS